MLYDINSKEDISHISEFEGIEIKEYKQKLEDQLLILQIGDIDLKQVYCVEQNIENCRKDIIKSINSRINEYEY